MAEEPVYCIESGAGGEQKKRKNRWGNPQGEPVVEAAPAEAVNAKCRRARPTPFKI